MLTLVRNRQGLLIGQGHGLRVDQADLQVRDGPSESRRRRFPAEHHDPERGRQMLQCVGNGDVQPGILRDPVIVVQYQNGGLADRPGKLMKVQGNVT